MYDLLIKNADLLDPAQGLNERKDLAIERGRIAAMEKDISPGRAYETLDAAGHLVTPGLIDSHVHVYSGVSHYGIAPDPTCLARGVTTVIDAGSAGADTWAGFKRYVIDISETRIRAFLNISSLGMVSSLNDELENIKHADPERAVSVCERHRGLIQGVKVRMTRTIVGANGIEPLKRARRAADALGLPIMVHPNDAPVPLADILGEMRAGDMITHCYQGRAGGILDEGGALRPEVKEAAERGVVFDVGHGQGSFSFQVAERALSQGLPPGTISSDLHFYNVHGPVFDLATTMSKFLLLGLDLGDVLTRTTAAPARLFGLDDCLGALKEGYLADITILALREGRFTFEDCETEIRTGTRKLEPAAVIKGGRIYANSLPLTGRTGAPGQAGTR